MLSNWQRPQKGINEREATAGTMAQTDRQRIEDSGSRRRRHGPNIDVAACSLPGADGNKKHGQDEVGLRGEDVKHHVW
jgi:hypothetical protein